MSNTAFQTQYRQEFVAGFEQRQTLLRLTVTSEAQIKGNAAVFLVGDSGSATAVTRGVNGLIPARADNLNQYTASLAEWHDLPRRTEFNIFASQSDGRRIMQQTTMGVMNRKIDQDIIGELSNATVTAGTATTASLAMVAKSKAILGLAKVPWDGNLFGIISPAYESYLLQVPEFTKATYVDVKALMNVPEAWADMPRMFEWVGVKWIVHPSLPGAGTASETCFLYHKSAIGHAANTTGVTVAAGYNDEQDYSWARTSIYMGSKLLQNSGVVKMLHDGSAFVGS